MKFFFQIFYLITLGNPTSHYLRKICLNLTKKTRERFSKVFIFNFGLFSSVSADHFGQVNDFSVAPYYSANAETTYCCNY